MNSKRFLQMLYDYVWEGRDDFEPEILKTLVKEFKKNHLKALKDRTYKAFCHERTKKEICQNVAYYSYYDDRGELEKRDKAKFSILDAICDIIIECWDSQDVENQLGKVLMD